MAKQRDQTGVVRVNGAWATRVTFEMSAEQESGDRKVALRFLQGRSEVLQVTIPRTKLAEVLGERNAATIETQRQNAPKGEPMIKGELRGTQLHYQEVRLDRTEPGPAENSIEVTRHRKREPAATSAAAAETTAKETDADKHRTARESTSQSAATEGPIRRPAPHVPVPSHIASKYLVHNDRYHFDDQTLAFIDRGSKLTIETHNRAVLQDVIAIAKARDWQEIKVTGTEVFRREVWKEATAAGLTVRGYTPSDLEKAGASRARGEPQRPEERSPEQSSSSQRTRDPAKRFWVGTLIAHGEARYQHEATKPSSYFVTLRDDAGRERTHWGVGLAEAINTARSAPRIGETVGLRQVGATPVSVLVNKVDPLGGPVTEHLTTQRTQWVVEKIDHFKPDGTLIDAALEHRSSAVAQPFTGTPRVPAPSAPMRAHPLTRDQEVAAAIRSARTTREELQLKFPQINKAVFSHMASHDQFARAFVEAGLIRESDRGHVIAQMRERLASHLERGTPIKEPDNNHVASVIRLAVQRAVPTIAHPSREAVAEQSIERVMRPKTMVREEPQVRV